MSQTTDLHVTPSSGGCACGHHDTEVPALDAREIPHAIRHGAILGAVASLPVGGALDLTAPHNPTPLLAQIDETEAGAIEVAYLVSGPEAWTLRLTRTR